MSGSNSSLPDAGAEAVRLTVHSVPALDANEQRTRAGRWKMLALLAVCAAPVVASYFTYFVIRPEGRSNYAALIEPPLPMPDLRLADLDGRPVAAASLKGQWLLVAVGSGACDTACEARLYAQRQLREMTGRERDRVDKVWLVTDDAPVDARLRRALADAVPPVQVLRVPGADLARWLAPAPGQSLHEHLYVVDPIGHWMMRAPADLEPAKFKRDIERLLRASSSWDRAGR
jgi:hypothetical protein